MTCIWQTWTHWTVLQIWANMALHYSLKAIQCIFTKQINVNSLLQAKAVIPVSAKLCVSSLRNQLLRLSSDNMCNAIVKNIFKLTDQSSVCSICQTISTAYIFKILDIFGTKIHYYWFKLQEQPLWLNSWVSTLIISLKCYHKKRQNWTDSELYYSCLEIQPKMMMESLILLENLLSFATEHNLFKN